MTIAFYKVSNSLNYDRHEFDNLYDQPELIKEMLERLPDEEVRMYVNEYSFQTRLPSLADFEQDYNDEILDGGWWCIVIPD